jgi:hypothetical protein
MRKMGWLFFIACAGTSATLAQTDSSDAPGTTVAVSGGLGVSLIRAADVVD